MSWEPTRPEERARLTRGAALASMTVAVLLVTLKAWASWQTNSTAMLGSLADSALDLAASVATLVGVWIAAMPADEDHRFGHGKAEALAAIVQVVLIAVSAIGLLFRGIAMLFGAGETQAAGEGIAVSVIAIAVTLALVSWQRHVVRRTGSVAIKTDSVHYKSDLMLNVAVIAALALDQYAGFTEADPLFGIAIALWLAWGAWNAASEAVDHLMDKEWPESRREEFLRCLARQPELTGVHDLRTRTSGAKEFVQFHAAMDGGMQLRNVHRIMDEIEARIGSEFPGVEVLIHPDPTGLVNESGAAAQELLPDTDRSDLP